jgi:hypothetical protein
MAELRGRVLDEQPHPLVETVTNVSELGTLPAEDGVGSAVGEHHLTGFEGVV